MFAAGHVIRQVTTVENQSEEVFLSSWPFVVGGVRCVRRSCSRAAVPIPASVHLKNRYTEVTVLYTIRRERQLSRCLPRPKDPRDRVLSRVHVSSPRWRVSLHRAEAQLCCGW